jgi:hypothetical protein
MASFSIHISVAMLDKVGYNTFLICGKTISGYFRRNFETFSDILKEYLLPGSGGS